MFSCIPGYRFWKTFSAQVVPKRFRRNLNTSGTGMLFFGLPVPGRFDNTKPFLKLLLADQHCCPVLISSQLMFLV